MTAPIPLTPRMTELLTRIQRANRPPFHTLTPQQARTAYRMGAEILDLPRAPLARVEDLEAAGRPARLYAPDGDRLPVMLYLHGGGFTIGDLETHDSLCRQLSARSGAAVLALDYRLAPEHRFPAAVDDAWARGDSAGGTLAAGAALFARDRGLPLALQLLITPGTDSHMSYDSHRRFAEGYLLDAKSIEWFFGHYIDAAQRSDWRFAPLHADDHAGLAPAAVLLAEADPLVDEGLAYADVLRAAGVPVQLDLVRGVTHDFIKMGRALPEALTALDFCAAALREHLQP
jgi:acetyl esterase